MKAEERRLLALHRELVGIPSVSHQEKAIADAVEAILRGTGVEVHRVGDNVLARAGRGPKLILNSHLDTVPPTSAWTRDPHRVDVESGKVFGLGSNDAKAAVAGMIAALVRTHQLGGPCEVLLMLVPEEETGGKGTECVWPLARDLGFAHASVVVGEPTGLDIAIAQKGLLILELITEGDACHAANAEAQGARNAVRALARDLVALEDLDLGPAHPILGKTTLEPTVTAGGTRRNIVPDRASSYLDLRTVPGMPHADLITRIQSAVEGKIRVHSNRLLPRECAPEAAIVTAAWTAHPTARIYGSRTMSDLVYFDSIPAIKIGPGRSERSHTPDEFVLESEVIQGARFYSSLIPHFAAVSRH